MCQLGEHNNANSSQPEEMTTYLSCASSFAVLDFVYKVTPEDLADVQRPTIFLDGCQGILDVELHLSFVLILNHFERWASYFRCQEKKQAYNRQVT